LAAFTSYEMRLFKRLSNGGGVPDGIDEARDTLIQTLQRDLGASPTINPSRLLEYASRERE